MNQSLCLMHPRTSLHIERQNTFAENCMHTLVLIIAFVGVGDGKIVNYEEIWWVAISNRVG